MLCAFAILFFVGVNCFLYYINSKLNWAVQKQSITISSQDKIIKQQQDTIRGYILNDAYDVDDAAVLAVIEPVHPIFQGTKIPGRVLQALRNAGYGVTERQVSHHD